MASVSIKSEFETISSAQVETSGKASSVGEKVGRNDGAKVGDPAGTDGGEDASSFIIRFRNITIVARTNSIKTSTIPAGIVYVYRYCN